MVYPVFPVTNHAAMRRGIKRAGWKKPLLVWAGMVFAAAQATAAPQSAAALTGGRVANKAMKAKKTARAPQAEPTRLALNTASTSERAKAAHAAAETIMVDGHYQVDSAAYQAPTKAPLSAFQPTSVISQHFIENNIPPSGGYDTMVALAPSVMTIGANGPGLAENKVSIRGFSDGQYNVLFDGIPFADGNNFTHHTTSYYTAHDLGDISVDRGPGDASTMGYATFGGTIAVGGKAPTAQRKLEAYGSIGAWNTYTYGGEFNSGRMKRLNNASFVFDAGGVQSDG